MNVSPQKVNKARKSNLTTYCQHRSEGFRQHKKENKQLAWQTQGGRPEALKACHSADSLDLLLDLMHKGSTNRSGVQAFLLHLFILE